MVSLKGIIVTIYLISSLW